jgi:hypothetical protein
MHRPWREERMSPTSLDDADGIFSEKAKAGRETQTEYYSGL